MASGFQTTLDLLATTRNEAAVKVLLPQFDSPRSWVRDGVFATLLRRRSPAGHLEVLRRLRDLPDHWRSIVQRYYGRMSTALRDAILSGDPLLCQNACHAILWFHEYDLMPTLVNAAEDHANPNADSAAATVLRLAERLSEELSGQRDYHDRRDPRRIRTQLLPCLENSLARYSEHKRLELVEAFLVLAGCESHGLRAILAKPLDPRHRCVTESLVASPLSGVMRLLLDYLDDPQAPRSVIQILNRRGDIRFLTRLLHMVHKGISNAARHHLKQIRQIPSLSSGQLDFEQLDEPAAQGLIRLTMATGISRAEKLSVLDRMLKQGSPKARRDACVALGDFNGQQAGILAFALLDDPEPAVQARAVVQVRQRGIPGTMAKLVELLDSPHEIVRSAARDALDEFSFDRFLASFETLNEQLRQSTGEMVRKVDPDSADRLLRELEAPSITHRIRAIEMAVAMALVSDIAEALREKLKTDEDHFVRFSAAEALAHDNTPETRDALSVAMDDANRSVQEVAKAGLAALGPLVV